MNLQQAIGQADSLRPNHIDEALKVRWLSALEGKIYHEIMRGHIGAPKDPYAAPEGERPALPYNAGKDMQAVLMVPEPYDDVYPAYLAAMYDYANGETAMYNNSMVVFNLAWATLADWYNRTHRMDDPYMRLSL